MGKGFKEFIAKGNLIQIAIASIMGAAFAMLVKSFGGDLLRSAHQHRNQLPDRTDGPQDGEVGPGGAPAVKVCPYCKTEIPIDAVRCPHCTSQLDSA